MGDLHRYIFTVLLDRHWSHGVGPAVDITLLARFYERYADHAVAVARRFNRAWDARCAKAGVPKITVHDGRRSCGTLLADLDVHPRVAMQILRHARFSLTMEIYTLASSAATRDALERLGKSLDGARQLYQR
jgi:integrase